MQLTSKHSPITAGFLTVIGSKTNGLVGGYLMLNERGRPLEFHCTAPVCANRAQEILYGTTLDAYLYGEQIAAALINRSRAKISAIFTDLPSVLPVRDHCDHPLAVVQRQAPESSDVAGSPAANVIELDAFQLWTSPDHPGDRKRIESCAASVARWIDLDEPFARIREAIDEAQRTQAA